MKKRKTIEERLSERFVKTPGGCWYWTGHTDRDGYGRILFDGRDRPAHRVMMMTEGHRVDGLDVDHLCRNRRCVNPAHLDVVTRSENSRRMWAHHGQKQMCKNGHAFNEENTYTHLGRRNCRVCNRAAAARYKAAIA